MKKIILSLLLSLFVTGCFVPDLRSWPLVFVNNSDIDIYAIIDLNVEDDRITEGSVSSHVEHNSLIYIGRNYRDGPWHDAVGETFHVYILDRTIYNIPAIYINESLTEEDIELIPKEMIITRMTVNRDDFTKDGDRIVYPPYETDKMK